MAKGKPVFHKFNFMAEIKNLHLLQDLSDEDILKMEHAAKEHKRLGGMEFKVIEADKTSVVIQIAQNKYAAGIYHSQKRLIEIVHETFDRFFEGKKVKVHPIPFILPKPSVVDAAWVNSKMLSTKTKLKDISIETGIDYTQLSALINGTRPMSQTVQAMFYFYFKSK
jgi:hypothetical protein